MLYPELTYLYPWMSLFEQMSTQSRAQGCTCSYKNESTAPGEEDRGPWC